MAVRSAPTDRAMRLGNWAGELRKIQLLIGNILIIAPKTYVVSLHELSISET